mmetsp:Transcript_15367/g.60064  ORF Transcript_15367/g.60064 Transcript_15367/m.60064 type:complete len:635 (+) Transcript_15367:2-1906(+)
MEAGELCIGIDLGTTYSCVAVWEQDQATIISNKWGNRTTPSWVAFAKDDGEQVVGEAAKSQSSRNPANTIYDSKRIIGRKFAEVGEEERAMWPFTVVQDPAGEMAGFLVTTTEAPPAGAAVLEQSAEGAICSFVRPEQIGAAVLVHMKQVAEEYLGSPVRRAVITVPAYFSDAQRHATKDAAHIAGLEVARILNEPTAAALAYGFGPGSATEVAEDEAKVLLIFDFGGGTLDVSVLQVDGAVFEVLSTAGDTRLGGEDIDNNLVQHCLESFYAKEKALADTWAKPTARALKRLKEQCQYCKHSLSQTTKGMVEVEAFVDGIDLDLTVTREKFDELNQEVYARCLAPVERALRDAGLQKEDVHDVVLIGGSTRNLRIQELLSEFFGGKALCKRINPEEAVAYGAAIQAANLTLDAEKKEQSAIKGLVLMDVTPMSLGIELAGRKMSVIIPRNTTVPYAHTKVYYNNEDNQTFVNVEVYEGEEKKVTKNRMLGSFKMLDLPPRPRGKLQINVTFNISTDGILTVTADVNSDDKAISGSIVIDQDKGLLDPAKLDELRELSLAKEQCARYIAKLEEFVYAIRKEIADGEEARKEWMETRLRKVEAWIAENKASADAEMVKELGKRLKAAFTKYKASE